MQEVEQYLSLNKGKGVAMGGK